MKMASTRFFLFYFLCATTWLGAELVGQTPPVGSRIDYRQVTTHPDVDLSPRLSPDGKWLAYVSRAMYNYDVWIQSTRGGAARQVTFSKADDFYPVWYPNSKELAFVSQSNDAAGDIYRLKFKIVEDQLIPREEPQRITSYLGYDAYPSVSPDGKKIAFVSNRTGHDEIWFWNETTGKTNQLTFRGATHPAWSANQELIAFTSFRADSADNGDIYIMNLSGRKPTTPAECAIWDERELPVYRVTAGSPVDGFPQWSATADRLIFLRFDFDDNQDGFLSPADRGALWAADVNPEPTTSSDSLRSPLLTVSFNPAMVRGAIQLTAAAEQMMQPCYGSDRRIYFSSDRGGNLDVWSVPDSGFVRKMVDAASQCLLAEEVFPLPTQLTRRAQGPLLLGYQDVPISQNDARRLSERRIAFQRVIDYFPLDSRRSAAAYDQAALCDLYLKRYHDARVRWQWILDRYPQERETCAYAELALLGLRRQGQVESSAALKTVHNQLDSLIKKYQDQPGPAAETQIAIGDLYFQLGDNQRAFKEYNRVLKEYPNERDACGQSQLKIGDVFSRFAGREEVMAAYLAVIENYPEQRQWMQPARDRILDLLVKEELDESAQISRYREIVGQYQRVSLLSSAAQLRIAELLYHAGEYQAAIREYELVESLFPNLVEEAHAARLGASRSHLKLGDNLDAFTLLQSSYEKEKSSRPDLAEQTRDALLQALLASADQLKASRDYELALMRYRLARDYDLRNLHAHRGYIECMYYLKQIRNAELEYEALNRKYANDNILIYALGLVYSYRGTERAELYGDPDGLDPEYLVHKSSATIARALRYDYTMVQPYLTISYNYEMMENYEARLKARPVPFHKKAYRTLTAPVVTLYRTVMGYEESRSKRYYEKAIHELNKALVLNDETLDPFLEAGLALNLANNYYNLGEYGYAKAYEFYHVKLKYDSSFGDPRREALVYEHMGHCALAIDDAQKGPDYLLRAIKLYQQLGRQEHVRLNTKRLALLYETDERRDLAIDCYQNAAAMELRDQRWDDLMRSYRSIALNYLQLAEPQDALIYSRKAMELIDQGKVKIVKVKPKRVQLGFFGLYFPMPFVNLSSAFTRFTTADEKALLFTIMGESYEMQKDYGQAIQFLEKKIALYREREDRWSESVFLNNAAYLYYLKGEPQKAWNSFKLSLEICEKEGITQGVVLNALSLGRIMSGLNRENQAQPFLSKERTAQVLAGSGYAAQKINMALKVLDANLPIYSRPRCQLLLLLAELTQTGVALPPEDLAASVQSTLSLLQKSQEAKTYLDEASRISRENFLHAEEALAVFASADLLFHLGDLSGSYLQLIRSRKLALRHGLFDVLWQSDVLLGRVVAHLDDAGKRQLLVQQDPLEFYLEAIDVLEAHTPTMVGAFKRVNAYAMEKPYRCAVAYLIGKGDAEGALAFAERMRAKAYYDMMQGETIELRKERHKIFLSNARYLQRQLFDLSGKLLAARDQNDVTPRQLREWESQRQEMQKEYDRLLVQVRQEIPELESLIHVRTVPLKIVQQKLRPQEAIFYYLHDDSTYVWRLTAQEVSLSIWPQSRADIGVAWASGRDQIQTLQDSTGMMASLLAPVVQGAQGLRSVIIAPDPSLMLLPWAGMLQRTATTKQTAIAITSSLTAYEQSVAKRRMQGRRLYLVEDRLVAEAITAHDYALLYPVPGQTENSFSGQAGSLALADIIHLRVDSDWQNLEPLQSLLGFTVPRSAPARFTLRQLYQTNLNASLLCLNTKRAVSLLTDPEPVLALERSAVYAGASALLFSLWPGTTEEDRVFFSSFYKHLTGKTAAEALAATQQELLQSGQTQAARFQLYGFGGMNRDEEVLFASEGFESMVRRGHSAFDLAEYGDAVRYYEEALQMARRQGDDSSRVLLTERILESAVNGGLWEKAIEIQKPIVEAAEKKNDVSDLANGYNNLAYFYTQSKQYDEAILYKNRYTSLTVQHGLKEEEAEALRETGLIYEHGQQSQQAVSFYQMALEKYQKLHHTAGAAACLRDLGRINFMQMDNYAAALQYQQQAVHLLQLNETVTSDQVDGLQNLGLIYEKMGSYKLALGYQVDALARAAKLKDERLQAVTHQYLANLHWKMGDYFQALQNQKIALAAFEKLQDKKLRQAALSTMGLIHLSLGQDDQALAYSQKALDLAVATEDLADQSTIYKNIAAIHRSKKQFIPALAGLEQAARLDSIRQSRSGMAYTLRNLAALHLEMGDYKIGLQQAQQALTLSRSLHDLRNEAQSRLVLSMAFHRLAELDSARLYAQMAEEQSDKYLMPEIAWRACKERAAIHLDEKNTAASVAALYKALTIIEALRSTVKVEDYTAGFMDDKAQVYGQLISCLFELDKPAEALQVAERARSRSFLDLIANRSLLSTKPQDERWLARGDSLQALLQQAESQVLYYRTQSDSTRMDLWSIAEKQVQDLRTAYTEYLQQMAMSNSRLSEMVQVTPPDLTALQSNLPDSVALLSYYVHADHLYIWLVTKQGISCQRQAVLEQQLVDQVSSLRKALQRQLAINEPSQTLSNLLIKPFGASLVAFRHLVIVPFGGLHYLPFNVLMDETGTYLGLQYSLSFAPSAGVLLHCLHKGDAFAGSSVKQSPVMAFGNPRLLENKWDLPFAGREVKSLTRFYPHVTMFLNERATETAVKEAAPSPLLLFSCHGEFDETHPLMSAILLSADQKNDGRLNSYEIMGLDLNAYVTAVSACETGLATVTGGDEVIGLTRSFIFAGSASVLSSLWKVDDLATAVLIKRFFRYLAGGDSRAEALRKAQKVVYEQINPYPSFWAAFTLNGDFR